MDREKVRADPHGRGACGVQFDGINGGTGGDMPSERKKWVFTLRLKVMVIFFVLTVVPLTVMGYFSFRFSEDLILQVVVR